MWPIIWAGASGGIAPHLARIAGAGIGNPNWEAVPPLLSMLVYCCGVVGFAALGGGMAYFLHETSRKSAFLLGIAAPALFANALNSYQDAKLPQRILFPSKISSEFSFVSPASAAEQSWAEKIQPTIDRILSSKATIRLGEGERRLLILAMNEKASTVIATICFLNRDNLSKFNEALKGKDTPEITCSDQEFIRPKHGSFTTLLVPLGAIAVMVNGDLFAIDKPELAVGINLDTRPTFSGDLLWALGGKRTEAIVTTTVKELSR